MLDKKKKKRENGGIKVKTFAKKMRKKPPKSAQSEENLKGITDVSVYLLHRVKDRCYRVLWSTGKCVFVFYPSSIDNKSIIYFDLKIILLSYLLS